MLSSGAQDRQPVDLTTIDGVLDELLDQITIENGEEMDTSSIRNLFFAGARLAVADSGMAESVSIDDFLVLLMDPYYAAGYEEKELYKKVDQYNGIAQVFQTFYGCDSEGTDERGINSYQLTYYAERWWIVSMLWTIESAANPIPERYLE